MKKRTKTKSRARRSRKSRSGWDVACEIASRFPGVEIETSYGTPALKASGKFLARLRTEAEGWMAIRCEFLERDLLLSAAPNVFHLTDHYVNYAAVLVDLDEISRDALEDVIENGWRMAAPKKLVVEFDEVRKRAAPRSRRPNARR